MEISQKDSERIIEISLETLNELGFTVSKKLIFEIMGKHSNIILVDMTTGKIIDSIKRVSIDVNRVRQVLPGKEYEYPPAQDKLPFKAIACGQLDAIDANSKAILSKGRRYFSRHCFGAGSEKDRYGFLQQILESIASGTFVPRVYLDEKDVPQEFHITDLTEYEDAARRMDFKP